MADNAVATTMKGLKLVVIIAGWIVFFLGTIFVMTLMGVDWSDFDYDASILGIPFCVAIFGWAWPLLLALALVLAIIAAPTYGVYRLAKYTRNRFAPAEEA